MKQIQLSQNKVALIDDEDFEWLNQWKWTANKMRNKWYATRRTESREYIYMHRLILGITDPNIRGDHKDGDGLNNRRYNLRISTPAQNASNRGKNVNNKTGYKGVRYQADGYYIAEINKKYLGCFHSPEDAARAYDKAAKQYHGEFAYLNFPDS